MWTQHNSGQRKTKELNSKRHLSHQLGNPVQLRIKRIVDKKIQQQLIKTKLLSLSPGTRNVVAVKRIMLLKFFWLSLIIASFSLCIYQAINRIIYYSTEPTISSVTLEIFERVNFPIINYCVVNSAKLYEYKDKHLPSNTVEQQMVMGRCLMHPLTDFMDNATAEQLWSYSSSRTDSTVLLYERNKPLLPIQHFLTISDVDYPYFKCITITQNKPLAFEGRKTKLMIERIPLTSPCGPFENVFTVYEPGGVSNYRSIYFTGAKTDIDVALSYKQFLRLNTANSPCISQEVNIKCVQDCIQRKQQQLNLTCRVPFMEGQNNLPGCTNKSDGLKSVRAVWKVLIETDRERECKCVPVCSEKIYSVARTANSLNLASKESRLNFFYPTNYYTLIREKLAYDFIALLCDIGGNLGLYLGLSTITIIEIVESLLELNNKKSK